MATARKTTFGELLRRYRVEAGFTQEGLASQARMSRRAISDLERGARTKPWRHTVALLADALSLSAADREALEGTVDRTQQPRTPLLHPAVVQFPTAEMTSLIGREHDEATIVYLLGQENVRLLTLTGVGGVGKTRLALRVANTMHEMYPDGVHFVPLAPLRDSRHIVSAVASVLGLQETHDRTLRQTLENFLRPRRHLLLLDNFEHVLDGAFVFSELLAVCPQLTLLITSRESLHLSGEHEYVIAPLAAPPASEKIASSSDLARYPASALFLSRARSARSSVCINQRQATAVGKICRLLDGLPLAIELAAARLKYDSPQQLVVRLEHRFDVLIDGPRDLPARQQTMRACIAWSYELLSQDEQDIFCRLAIFSGGCTADAIEAVVRTSGPVHSDIMETVHSLVDKSLSVIELRDDEPARFTFLATIREYALERLEERSTFDRVCAAYARFYLELAEEAWNEAFRADELTFMRKLAAERDNIRAVLEWSLDHDLELGLKMAGSLVRFWGLDGHYGEWRHWINEALTIHSDAAPPVRAKALVAAGWMALQEGDVAAAITLFREGWTVGRDCGDAMRSLSAMPGLGFAELSRGSAASAIAVFRAGIDTCNALGATQLLGPFEYGLGLAIQVQGDLEGARQHLEDAVKLFQDHGERISIGSALRALGGVALAQGDLAAAWSWFEDGLQTALSIKHRDGIVVALEGTAAILAALGQLERAAFVWGAAEAVYEELHGPVEHDNMIPFARLPQLSPHLAAIAAQLSEPEREVAQAEGYAAPLVEVIALLHDPKLHPSSGIQRIQFQTD